MKNCNEIMRGERAELSKKNPYYISKHRYYELKHFCRQYDEWKRALVRIDGWKAFPESTGAIVNATPSNPTEQMAMARAFYSNRVDLLENCLGELEPANAPYILRGVTEGQTTKSFAPTRNSVNTITVPVDELSLGSHTVKVVVTDGQGGTATRTWTFTRTNAAPTISGTDTNLGDKNLGFTYQYTVDDADGDTLTVVEALNDETLRTINNAPRGEALNVTITGEKLYSLSLNSVNTITITVTDGKGGTAYRRLTFKRTNSAPAISGADTDLGLKTGSFAENYTITDVEGDNVVVTEFVDDDEIRSYQATLGEEATIELTREKWLTLANGTHQLRVEAVDGNFATSVRAWIFSKAENTIAFQFSAPEETDARATKILITPTWKIEGAVAKVEACNNAFDAVPTWEDITAMVQLNRVFNFTNETKTADKWGVNVRFTIVKNEGYEGEVSISGFGGAYE